jgi:flavorubredoxin
MPFELYRDARHVVLSFSDLVDAKIHSAVQCNQFLIVSDGEGALIDPAGNMTYNALLMEMNHYFPHKTLKYILASHQDPDIVASLNRWLSGTDAVLYVSRLWERFVPHFCTLNRTEGRVVGIPDQGMGIPLGESRILCVPAHFLHSEGNFQFYDPRSKILFSGDMGVSLVDTAQIPAPISNKAEFVAMLPAMEGFHRRYMTGNKPCRLWANMVRGMDVEMMVPQHGRWFKGRDAIHAFLDWIVDLECGTDIMTQDNYRVPA